MNAHNEQQALPCPFCGTEPDLSFNSVSCGCAASPFIDREDALRVWNTRVTQPAAAQLGDRLDRAYTERNALAIAFAKAALAAGWRAGRGYDDDQSKDWAPEWRHVVYVDLPDGRQVSWHMAPAEVELLDRLPQYAGEWNGEFTARDPSWCRFDASAAAQEASVIEQIAQQWDGCMFDSVGETIDIGEAIRAAGKRLSPRPAAAQEAVGWQWRWLDTDNTWSEWTDGGSRKEIDARIARWKADGEDHRMQVRPVFAAPVTAAPADTWLADQLTAMGEVIPLASTPAAPGIDLPRWISVNDRLPGDADYGDDDEVLVVYRYTKGSRTHWQLGASFHEADGRWNGGWCFGSCDYAEVSHWMPKGTVLALIDASPKGDEAQPANATTDTPLPMDTAPRDGTVVRLLVQFEEHLIEDTDEPAWTIGACNDDLVPEDERTGWQVAGWCWDHDHFTEGKGTPVGWLPLIDASPKGGSEARDAELKAAQDAGHDGAIRYVLGYLNGTGDCGSTMYEEILNACGRDRIIKSAIADGELEFTGLADYIKLSGAGSRAEKRRVRAALRAQAQASDAEVRP